MDMIDKERYIEYLVDLHYYNICQNCYIVDRDPRRSAVGYKCPRCGFPGEGGILYYDINVFSLLDLMQEFYFLKSEKSERKRILDPDREEGHHIAIVILFCSLAEVLLNHFLNQIMEKRNIPLEIQERLLQDNLHVIQRIDRLFPSLAGMKWTKAIKKIDKLSKYNYEATIDFYLDTNLARNNFLHRGYRSAITNDMPMRCIDNVEPLINMFVDLHNHFIALAVKQAR
jgi:hypothetical protein